MKSPLALLSITTACLTVGLTGPVLAENRSVAEFDQNKETQLDWQVVNDGVMGGLSQGKIEISKDGLLTFNGTLSLKNNGGFSSIRSKDVALDLGDFQGLSARVKGDGRTYQMRLATGARHRGMEVSFMAEFPTTKGEWTEVKVPFEKFVGSFRGMTLKDTVFNPAKISRVGLILADKKSGPFKLQVDWIRAYKGETKTIVDQALADGRFKTLAAALKAANLAEALQGDGPFTVFAPTDEAFAKLPDGTVASLLKPENQKKLQAILKFHVSSGSTPLAAALQAGQATTLQGEELTIAFSDGRVRVDNAAVLTADIPCSNGIIHIIDSVLLPPTPEKPDDLLGVAKAAGNFTTLLAAIDAAGLTSALQGAEPLTILAPTDKAFAKLPKETLEMLLREENRDQLKAILTYHAIPGKVTAGDALNAKSAATVNGQNLKFEIKNGSFQVNGAKVLTTDIECSNGLLHIIDAVLLPKTSEAKATCKDATGETTAIERIESAITRGVPVFNDGDHAACAKIYKDCLSALVMDEQIDAPARQAMKRLLESSADHGSATERAWLYRKSLDHIHHLLSTSNS